MGFLSEWFRFSALADFSWTVTIQRVGLLPDFTSMTERTNPVTSDPFTSKAVFWPRCWSYRQRLATFASVVVNVCMFYPKNTAAPSVSGQCRWI
jgi:hypothetical protein